MEETHEFSTGLRAYLGRAGAESPPAETGARLSDVPAVDDEPGPASTAREQQFAEQVRAFEAHVARFEQHERAVAERERQLAEREAELSRHTGDRRPVRETLRDRAELSVDRLLQVFDDALAATHANGAPDHAVRLAAVRVLLGEAYAAGGDGAAASAAMDELAALRERRAADSV